MARDIYEDADAVDATIRFISVHSDSMGRAIEPVFDQGSSKTEGK